MSFCQALATTAIYTLSLHDALPISRRAPSRRGRAGGGATTHRRGRGAPLRPDPRGAERPARGARLGLARRGQAGLPRSEEHTSELQSHSDLVCRLLLEKKKKKYHTA